MTDSGPLKDAGKSATTGGVVGAVMLLGGWIGFGDMPKQMARVETEVALIRRDMQHVQVLNDVVKGQYNDRLTTAEDRIKNIASRVKDLENVLPRYLPNGRSAP